MLKYSRSPVFAVPATAVSFFCCPPPHPICLFGPGNGTSSWRLFQGMEMSQSISSNRTGCWWLRCFLAPPSCLLPTCLSINHQQAPVAPAQTRICQSGNVMCQLWQVRRERNSNTCGLNGFLVAHLPLLLSSLLSMVEGAWNPSPLDTGVLL